MPDRPIAIIASEAPARPLGEVFGLANFGVTLTRLAPGAASSLRHAHARQDEFITLLEGHPVLMTAAGETPLSPSLCAGFAAGTGGAQRLVNRTARDVVLLEVGDRTPLDRLTYPEDDLAGEVDAAGRFHYHRKDGTPL